MTFKRHNYLYLEKDAADTVFMLEQGMVMLTKRLPDGHEVGIILLSGKNLFGHCELLSCTQREHQAKTLTPCKLWAVNVHSFLKKTKESAEFAMALARPQNERLRHVEQHIRSITQDNVARRLASTLLEIAHSSACETSEHTLIKPCPADQELAIMISSTRETVSTIMNKFRNQNIIAFDRKEISILNKKLLTQY